MSSPIDTSAGLCNCHYDFFRKDPGRCQGRCCPGAAAAAPARPPAAANLGNRSAANRRQGLVLREWCCCRVVQVHWSEDRRRRSTTTRRWPACRSGPKRTAWCSCYLPHVLIDSMCLSTPCAFRHGQPCLSARSVLQARFGRGSWAHGSSEPRRSGEIRRAGETRRSSETRCGGSVREMRLQFSSAERALV